MKLDKDGLVGVGMYVYMYVSLVLMTAVQAPIAWLLLVGLTLFLFI